MGMYWVLLPGISPGNPFIPFACAAVLRDAISLEHFVHSILKKPKYESKMPLCLETLLNIKAPVTMTKLEMLYMMKGNLWCSSRFSENLLDEIIKAHCPTDTGSSSSTTTTTASTGTGKGSLLSNLTDISPLNRTETRKAIRIAMESPVLHSVADVLQACSHIRWV